MKKLLFALVALAAIALAATSCGTTGAPKTEADSVAYYAGANLAQYVHSIDSTMSLDMLAAGLKDAMKRKEAASVDVAFNYLREYMMVRMPARKLAESTEYLAGIEKKNGVQKTTSGLLYQIEAEGDAVLKATTDYDQVRVVYHGTLPDGKVFDSSRERGDTAQFALNQVIRGWTEGMKLVGKGGKIKLWIPSELAYGAQGTQSGIGPNQAILFDVEVVDVIPAPAVAQ